MSGISESTRELIEQLLDGTISKNDAVNLEQLMIDDKNVRLEYLKAAQFESSMHFYAEGESEAKETLHVEDSPGVRLPIRFRPIRFRSVASLVGIVAAATLLVGLTLSLLFQPRLPHSEPSLLSLVSYDGSLDDFNGVTKLAGKLNIREGVLTMRTEGGSLISLEGPSEFEMTSRNEGSLTDGKIIVYCGEETEKLTINTSAGSYVDIGTEFGVSVDENRSTLHVFDGQVFATEVDGDPTRSVVVEGASAINSGNKGKAIKKTLVDFASFDRLRSSLSQGVNGENFSGRKFVVGNEAYTNSWKLNRFRLLPGASGKVNQDAPLSANLNECISFKGATGKTSEEHVLPFLEAEWSYADAETIDVSKAHTIECLIRFDCDPTDVVDFSIYGSGESSWKDRSWSVGAKQLGGSLMWSVFNSPRAVGSHKFQQLAIERGTPCHVLVEIDPVIGKFRTTVSDGQQRIWNELYDGSPVSLKPEPLGKLFWRMRGKANRKLAFSIDSIQVRNRPVFKESNER